ncbi:uncharacterized protein [Diadema antillarum]|uniref:uncharacterized protein n=1 Tax=Diadema antillarum TaxID=105358 RepID=UPI003A8C24A5
MHLSSACDPPCYNGGICVNGVCECATDTGGQFCQQTGNLEEFTIHIYPSPNNDHMVGKTVGFLCETNYTLTSESPQWYDADGIAIRSREEAPGSRVYYLPTSQNASYLVVNELNENDRGRYVCAAGLSLRVAMMLVVYVPQCMEPCLNGGTCFNDMCMCRMGFEGPRCEIELDRCPMCLNGGQCVDYKCVCPEGFVGTMCQIAVGEDYYIRLTVPSDQSPTVGSMVTVICEVVGWSSFGGIPTPSWIQPSGATVVNRLDDKDALMRGPTVEVLSSTAARLTVVNFQPFLSGNYNCTVGDQVASILLTLECWPECLNGGTCFNGKCLCTNEFRGERCEVPLSSLTPEEAVWEDSASVPRDSVESSVRWESLRGLVSYPVLMEEPVWMEFASAPMAMWDTPVKFQVHTVTYDHVIMQ